jgi:Ca2+-binding RTX toxin-like protein
VTITVAPAAGGSVNLIADTCEGGTALLIVGTAGDDNIDVTPGAGPGTLTVSVNGVTTTQPAPTGRIIIVAGAGNDSVHLAGSVGNSAWIYGEAGDDQLNAGNVTSGHGNLLIGGKGRDQINGGSGRDVMIGGDGGDKVVGNPGDDILVAGYTLKDDRAAAGHEPFWCDVMDEWGSTNAFAQRVNNLRNGSGGAAHNGTSFLLPQVRDDGDFDEVDNLNGSSGDDWFIVATGEDKVAGQAEASNNVQ